MHLVLFHFHDASAQWPQIERKFDSFLFADSSRGIFVSFGTQSLRMDAHRIEVCVELQKINVYWSGRSWV